MRHSHIWICGISALIIAGAVFFSGTRKVAAPEENINNNESTQIEWETKTDSQGDVTISVTPIALGVETWVFNVSMETHSVPLNEDMTKVAVLIDGGGKEYNPLDWTGAPPGGHHRDGTLVFGAIKPLPKSFALKINIGGIERIFSWQN